MNVSKGLVRIVSVDAGRMRALDTRMWPDIQAKFLAWAAFVDCCNWLSWEPLINV